MKENNENVLSESLSRRSFFKVAAGVAATAAVASTGMSSVGACKAFAATGDSVAVADMIEGQAYTCSANAYVPYSVHKMTLVGQDAYLTDPSNPLDLEGFPVTAQVDNAEIVSNGDGTFNVTIPIKNELFEWIELGTLTGATHVSETWVDARYEGNDNDQRIGSITLKVENDGGTPIYENPTEYANYPLIKATKNWDIYISVDFTSVKEN